MEAKFLLCLFTCLVGQSWQYVVDKAQDGMVSDPGHETTLTDGWNGVPRGCGGKPADIYFVMDTASSTSDALVTDYKRYLAGLSALFHVQKGSGTRVGVVSYGHTPFITTRLGSHRTLGSLQSAVENAPRIGGSRRTAQALKYLRQTAFSPFYARREVAHVVIILTNGYSADAKQTVEEADALRKSGVYVYAVADVSNRTTAVDQRELFDLVSQPWHDFVFRSGNWDIVEPLIRLLHVKECNYQVLPPLPGKEALCASRRPTQLAFAVEHLGLGSPKTRRIIAFIQDMLSEVDPDSDMKAAILTSKDPMSQHALSRHVNTVDLLEQELGGVTFPDLSQLLRRARRLLTKPPRRTKTAKSTPVTDNDTVDNKNKDDQHVQNVLLLFIDNTVKLTKSTIAAARALRYRKVDTYVVYVGEGETDGEIQREIGLSDLQLLASGKDHVIRIGSYGDLVSQKTVERTLKTVCRGL